MKKIISFLSIATLLLLASCGQEHDAKSHVKRFMTEQMGLNDFDVIAWSNIDSTHHVKDSMLDVMHRKAEEDKVVKAGIKYQPRTAKLNLMTVRYRIGNDTLMSTFYFDDKFEGIVGVKRD